MCSPMLHLPFGGRTEGALKSLGSRSVATLLVAERIVCAVMATPTATPASVKMDSRFPAPPVDYRTG